ncbi:MAG: hypothetical protein ACU85U_21775 [Gammaproteobacteria bacterium]|jgi:hypothetical protein
MYRARHPQPESLDSTRAFTLRSAQRAAASADIIPEINEARAAGRTILVLRAHDTDMSRNGTWVRYRREGDPDIPKFLEQSQVRITNGAIVRIGSTDFRVNVAGVPTPIVSVGR